MGLAEREVERVEWGRLTELAGSAERVGPALQRLLSARTAEESTGSYWQLENHVVAQASILEAAEPTVSVLVAALADERPRHVRIAGLDLLFQILSDQPHEPELRRGHNDLV